MTLKTRMLVAAVALSLSLANATPMMAASRSRPQVRTSPSGLTPASTQTTDLAPQIPGYDKATAIVRHPDGMYETFLVPPDQVDAFIRGLGNNELVTLVPPQSLVGHAPPPVNPSSGVVRYPASGAAPIPPAPPHHLKRAVKKKSPRVRSRGPQRARPEGHQREETQ